MEAIRSFIDRFVVAGANTEDTRELRRAEALWERALEAAGKNTEETRSEADMSEAGGKVFSKKILVGSTFPPYNESKSDANEFAARWAHREDVRAGEQKLVPHLGKWYLIEAFDDSPLGYQIAQALTARQYRQHMEDKSNGNIKGQSVQEDVGKLGELDSKGKQNGRRRLHTATSHLGQRGENITVREMGAQENAGRTSGGEKLRDYKSSGENQQGVGAVTDTTEKVKKNFSLKFDSEGRQLSEAQQEYFKDSKIRDEDGNLLVVYHGTNEDFTVLTGVKAEARRIYKALFSVRGNWTRADTESA